MKSAHCWMLGNLLQDLYKYAFCSSYSWHQGLFLRDVLYQRKVAISYLFCEHLPILCHHSFSEDHLYTCRNMQMGPQLHPLKVVHCRRRNRNTNKLLHRWNHSLHRTLYMFWENFFYFFSLVGKESIIKNPTQAPFQVSGTNKYIVLVYILIQIIIWNLTIA